MVITCMSNEIKYIISAKGVVLLHPLWPFAEKFTYGLVGVWWCML